MSETWSAGASMFLRPTYTLGGSLSLSLTELRFFGDENLRISLRDIAAVRVARQEWWHPRKTLQVRTTQGASKWFLVNRQAEVAARIIHAVREVGGQVDDA